MGKIHDAMERHKNEKSPKIEALPNKIPERLIQEDPEASRAREFSTHHEYSDNLVVLSDPNSVDAETFKLLRGKIFFSRDRERPKSIMITSAVPGEGKTFLSANLAVSIALSIDEHVLLVDCDLRRPRIHVMLGYKESPGLHEYLTGKKQLSDLIIRTPVDKLSVLFAGNLPPNPTELLSSSAMERFIEEVKGRYQDRFVVIDTAPSQATAEAGVLAKYVDGIILVVMAGRAPRETIHRTIHTLGKEKILGVFFNNYDQAYRSYNKYYKNYYQVGKKGNR